MTAAAKKPRTAPWRDVDAKALGARVRGRRVQLGLSQRELAFPGCSYAYLSRIEAGTRTASGHLLEELARRLGTTRRYLETGEETIAIELPLDLARRAVAADRLALEKLNEGEVDGDLIYEASRLQADVSRGAWTAIVEAVVALEEGGGDAAPGA